MILVQMGQETATEGHARRPPAVCEATNTLMLRDHRSCVDAKCVRFLLSAVYNPLSNPLSEPGLMSCAGGDTVHVNARASGSAANFAGESQQNKHVDGRYAHAQSSWRAVYMSTSSRHSSWVWCSQGVGLAVLPCSIFSVEGSPQT
jgi:hypothetical protein